MHKIIAILVLCDATDVGFYDIIKGFSFSVLFGFPCLLEQKSETSSFITNSKKGCFGNWALGIGAYGTQYNALLE